MKPDNNAVAPLVPESCWCRISGNSIRILLKESAMPFFFALSACALHFFPPTVSRQHEKPIAVSLMYDLPLFNCR